MRLKSISVTNFRNLSPAKIIPSGGLNLILGDNAQGKTNLLESVCLCCLGKSPRTDKDREMINYDADFARVFTEFESRYGSADIAVVLSKKRKKAVAVNSVPILKIGELLGYLNAVYFSPDEIRVIRMSPADRRRFLDVDLCQADKSYYYALVKYNKILNQRNNLIKKSRDVNSLKEMLFVWDAQLAKECARIVSKRMRFCDRLKTLAADAHDKLTDGKERLEISYVTQISGENAEQREKNMLELLGAGVQKDFELGYTTSGCQRDDLKFCVNGVDIRSFGSQGQQRTAALSLKLAELEIFKELTGDYPVLLLDDVLSELDLSRQKRLLDFCDRVQIILTATHLDGELRRGREYAEFRLKNGVVTRV